MVQIQIVGKTEIEEGGREKRDNVEKDKTKTRREEKKMWYK